jgi:hypothetical protein
MSIKETTMYTTIKEVMEAQLVTLMAEITRLNEVVVAITDENEARKLLLNSENATIRVLDEDVKFLQDTKMGVMNERNRLRKVNAELQRQLNCLYLPANSAYLGEVKIENAILTEANAALKAEIIALEAEIETAEDRSHAKGWAGGFDAAINFQVRTVKLQKETITTLQSKLEAAYTKANVTEEEYVKVMLATFCQRDVANKMKGENADLRKQLEVAEAKIPVDTEAGRYAAAKRLRGLYYTGKR